MKQEGDTTTVHMFLERGVGRMLKTLRVILDKYIGNQIAHYATAQPDDGSGRHHDPQLACLSLTWDNCVAPRPNSYRD